MNTEQGLSIAYAKKFTPLVPGDVLNYKNGEEGYDFTLNDQAHADKYNKTEPSDKYYSIVSFADRPNTGKWPVKIVKVDVIYNGEMSYNQNSIGCVWRIGEGISNWKPNHAALLDKYQSEQGANMNTREYGEKETKQATHYSANNNRFYIQAYNAIGGAMVLNDTGHWTYSDCTRCPELDSYEFFKLNRVNVKNKETAHHIALQIEELGNQDSLDIVIDPDEYKLDAALARINTLEDAFDKITSENEYDACYHIAVEQLDLSSSEVSDTPIYTQAMADAGELPPVGSECEIKHKDSNKDWARPGFYPATIKAYGDELFILESGGECDGHRESCGTISDCEFRPIDNRTDEEKLRDIMCQTLINNKECFSFTTDNDVDALLSSDKFTITLNKE